MAKELIGDKWIFDLLQRSQEIRIEPEENKLIYTLIDFVYKIESNNSDRRRLLLAAAFDLVVAAEYYRFIAHTNWFYCANPKVKPYLFYSYVNACPRCLLLNSFVYTKAHKPKSGIIGAKTSRLLGRFFETLFLRNGHDVRVLKGVEPVDLVVHDTHSKPEKVFFAEIKAAPIVTLPLAITTEIITSEEDGEIIEIDHTAMSISQLYLSEIGLFLPIMNTAWDYQIYPLGVKSDAKDVKWSYNALLNLIETEISFLEKYFEFWENAYVNYANKTQDNIYWLLNASGQPNPRPNNWPTISGGQGYESISDSKTSVGMDRTGDLKKATYQVLKLGAEGKPGSLYDYKVGIISNIHAVRHFDDYLDSLKDIMWFRDPTGSVKSASDLQPDTPFFNLFDGIISLTEIVSRDIWITDLFSF